MRTTLSKWGNSLAVRIPKPIADDLQITSGTEVQIEIHGNVLQVKPIQTEFNLEQLLKKVNKNNIHAEIKSGKPVGKEIW